MIKDEYYDYILTSKPTTQAKRILFEILHDLTDRRGLRQAWEQIDRDIKEELMQEWKQLIQIQLNRGTKALGRS